MTLQSYMDRIDASMPRMMPEREQIVDIYRAGVLRDLAEAESVMGDAASALALYAQAVEEGVHNINSRPRAEDLSATCRSMAVHGVAPDPELRERMAAIFEGLGSPW